MKISFDLPEPVIKELEKIAKQAGFMDLESLFRNYTRELILAARSDAAAQQAKIEVIARSDDLDSLMPQKAKAVQRK